MSPKNHVRAVRYRQLALLEPDRAKAAVLFKNADEAERDVRCVGPYQHGVWVIRDTCGAGPSQT